MRLTRFSCSIRQQETAFCSMISRTRRIHHPIVKSLRDTPQITASLQVVHLEPELKKFLNIKTEKCLLGSTVFVLLHYIFKIFVSSLYFSKKYSKLCEPKTCLILISQFVLVSDDFSIYQVHSEKNVAHQNETRTQNPYAIEKTNSLNRKG